MDLKYLKKSMNLMELKNLIKSIDLMELLDILIGLNGLKKDFYGFNELNGFSGATRHS